MISLFSHQQTAKKCKKMLKKYRFQAFGTRGRNLRQLRIRALRLLSQQIQSLARQGFCEEIVLGITEKKAEIILNITSDQDFGLLWACSYPHFNGVQYEPSVPEHLFIPEEECVHWANFFDSSCTSREGEERYAAVLVAAFPDADEGEIEYLRKNRLRRGGNIR